ncbi:TPA: HAD family phosphatase [Corynebacterium striatum]|uniref:HAD family hydrolase n=1 Tax=Corynebacterium striatum TaxID=43770 RepID=UPI001B9F5B95|nr:HAD family phosphatase [Corynebacterium striatum]
MAKLLFDMYGVLMRIASAEQQAELERLVNPADPARFWEAYQEFRPAYDAGIMSDSMYWNRISASVELGELDIAEAVELDNRYYMDSEPEMVALVQRLIGEGHTVGLLSNIPTTLADAVRSEHDWIEDCAAVVFSCDIGVAKPDAEAYKVAVDALAATAEKVHFFDDRQDFVDGAAAAGLQAHLFTSADDVRAIVDES